MRLAKDYGWVPLGVECAPYIDDKDHGLEKLLVEPMDYISYYNQIVIDDDAINLANALERSLEDICDCNLPYDDTITIIDGDLRKPESISMITKNFKNIDPVLYFGGMNNKEYIQNFIEFCRKGSFYIHRFNG